MINKNELENKINEYMETKYKRFINLLESEIDTQLIQQNGIAEIDKFKFIELMQDAKNKYSFKVFNNASREFLLLCSEGRCYSCFNFEKFLESSDDNLYGICLRYIIKKYYHNGYTINIHKISKFNYKLEIRMIK